MPFLALFARLLERDDLSAHDAAADALEIHVVAQQWMWKVEHPDGAAGDQHAARADR